MKANFTLFLLLTVLVSCQKDSPPPPSTAPAKATLVFPEQNSICTEGEVISPLEAAIDFRWNQAENTHTYELTIKNLVTGETSSKSTEELHQVATLKRGTPYSWFVTSKSRQTGATAKSDVFKFYNAGPGVRTYAPFPAEIVSPIMGQQIAASLGTISLDWTGNDVDGDLVSYDVYLGTSNSPQLLRSDVADSKLDGISITSNTTYYWRVVSRDSKGNTSDSGLFQFRVN